MLVNSIWVTVKKELRSMFRDRKTLITLLVFPILIPAMLFLYAYMYEDMSRDEVYLIGINYEANSTELTFLSEAHLEAKKYDSKEEMEMAYSKGEILGYIDYQEDKKTYYVYANEDSETGMYVSNYVTIYLDGYNQYLAKLYLIGEDIDVDQIYDNFSYEMIDLEGENWILSMMFTVAFTYIIMSIVLSTTNMATSATAVEKENGTLETILTFPIQVRDLVIGKYLAAVIMGIFSSFIGLVLTLGSLEIATHTFSIFDNIHYTISMGNVLISVLVVVLASFFIAGLSIALTSFAKTYKEAQSMSSVLNILTVIPMLISLMGMKIGKWYYLIPIFNYTQVLMDIFSGYLDLVTILMVVLSSIFYVVIVISYILVQYRTEKVLFRDVSS